MDTEYMPGKTDPVVKYALTIIEKLKELDYQYEASILKFLKDKYFPPNNLPLFTSLLPQSIKLISYFSFLIVFFFTIKIIHPENRFITLILISFVVITGILLIMIFLGFMQLLYY